MHEVGGMVQDAKAPGNAGDMQTWTTMDGLKGCQSEYRRHEHDDNVSV